MSGWATKKLMALGHAVERAYGIFGDVRYEGLATVSVAHLYNLRQRAGYQRHRQVWAKPRPVTIPLGERRAPALNNQPGYRRVDSVHQGDQDGVKGVLSHQHRGLRKPSTKGWPPEATSGQTPRWGLPDSRGGLRVSGLPV